MHPAYKIPINPTSLLIKQFQFHQKQFLINFTSSLALTMAQYGGEQEYRKEEGYGHMSGDQHGQNQMNSSTNTGHDQLGSTGVGHGTTMGSTGVTAHGYDQEGKHGSTGTGGGILHRSGSGSSSSVSNILIKKTTLIYTYINIIF